MPLHADRSNELSLQAIVHGRGLTHLRVRRRGELLVLESGPNEDPVRHARLRRQGVHIWLLDIATHTGRWEVTPFRGQMKAAVELLCTEFPWTLEPVV